MGVFAAFGYLFPNTELYIMFIPIPIKAKWAMIGMAAIAGAMEIVECMFFRVTRDADFAVSDEADDLLEAVELELRRRRFGEPVRVEVSGSCSARMGCSTWWTCITASSSTGST